MRAYQLTEYRHEVTAQQLGNKVYTAWKGEAKAWKDRALAFLMSKFDWANSGNNIPDSIMSGGKENPKEMIDFLIKGLELSDPTPHKEYTEWLARRYGEGHWHLEDVLSKMPTELKRFNELKLRKMLPPETRDINRFKNFTGFQSYVEKSWSAAGLEQKSPVGKGRAQEYYNDNEIRVIIPEDEEAACYYGQGTRWCTAGRESNMFFDYARRGKLYIIIPKHPQHTGEKYQFHFADEQFMDERDERIDLRDIVAVYPSLHTAFKQQAKQFHIFPLMTEQEQQAAYKGAEEYLLNVGKMQDDNILTVNISSSHADNGISWYRCKMIEAFTGQLMYESDFYIEGAVGVAVIDLRDVSEPVLVYTIGEAYEAGVGISGDLGDVRDWGYASKDQAEVAARVQASLSEIVDASDLDAQAFAKGLNFFFNQFGDQDDEPVNEPEL